MTTHGKKAYGRRKLYSYNDPYGEKEARYNKPYERRELNIMREGS